jgi:ABC-type amino acid transport substrate-binding protein
MRILYLIWLLVLPLADLAHAQAGPNAKDTLIVGYNRTPPFLMEGNGELVGPSYWLWQRLAEEHNLSYRLVELPLDSLLDGLATGRVDVSASPLTLTSDRLKRIHFTPPYHIEHASVLVPVVSPTQRASRFLRSFFSINFFRALGALAVVILVFGLLAWLFERKRNAEEFGGGIRGLWNGFWWSAVTMTTVGYGDKSPRTVGGRIVALIWMFTAIIIISGFTASIASSLTVNRIGSASNVIEDFKEKRLGTIAGSDTEDWLKDNFFTKRQGYQSMEELADALESQSIDAVAYDRAILQNMLRQDSITRYEILNIEFNPQFYGMGLNPNLFLELRKKLGVSTLELTEGMEWKVLLTEYGLD